jgi:hypothetical protein
LTTESKDVTAAETRLDVESELERIEQWRAQELERAGFSPLDAGRIAQRHDVDLHQATELISQGCPHSVALQILL